MSRLTVGYPVVGARTSDGSDAIQSVDPTVFALQIGLGTMSLQDADAVAVVGGSVNGTYVGMTSPSDGQFTSLRIVLSSGAPELKLAREDIDVEWMSDIDGAGVLGFSHRTPITGGTFTKAVEFIPGTGVRIVEGDLGVVNDMVIGGSAEIVSGGLTMDAGSLGVLAGDINANAGYIRAFEDVTSGTQALALPAGNRAVGVRQGVADNWGYLSSDASANTILAYKSGTAFSIVYETGIGSGRTTAMHVDATGKVIVDANAQLAASLAHTGSSIGFYGTTPIAKVTVSYPTAIVTTETASGSYGANEQTMLANLKTDVTNLRATLNAVVTALKQYGIFG